MDLRQLRYFIAIAEEANFSAAGRQLGISQPPLSRQIQALESELGHELFTRSSRGVRLTAAGAAFLPEARKTLLQAQIAVDRCHGAARGEVGRLQIGYFGSSIYDYLPTLLRGYRGAFGAVDTEMRFMTKREQIEGLRERTLDIGFGHFYSPEPDLEIQIVGQERLLVGMPAGHSGGVVGAIGFEALKYEPLILYPREGRPNFSDDVVRIFATAGLAPNIVQIANDATSTLSMVASGMGSTVVPESVMKLRWPQVDFFELEGGRFFVPITCIHRPDALRPVAANFLAFVASQTKRDGQPNFNRP